MAVVKNLMVRVGADFSSITQQSKKAAQSVKKMGADVKASTGGISASFKSIAAGAAKVGAAVAAFRAVYGALSDSIEGYKEHIEAETKLGQVMRTTMNASAAEIQRIKDLADAQERLGVVEGDAMLEGAQELATYLELSGSLETLIPAMNDMIAQQYGMAASGEAAASIATMIGKVMEGQTGALSRYGYYFTEAQEAILKYGTEAERAATLAEIIEQSVGGVNSALANTPTGQFVQLRNEFGAVKDQIGEAAVTLGATFIPLLQTAVGWLSTAATWAQRFASNFNYIFGGTPKKNAVAIAGASAETAAAVEDIADAYDNVSGSSAKAMKQLMGIDTLSRMGASGGGGGALAAAEQDIADYSETLAAMTGETSEALPEHSRFVEGLRGTWEHFLDLFRNPKKWFSEEWQMIKQNMKSIFGFDGGILNVAGGDAKQLRASLKKFFWDDGIKLAWDDATSLFRGTWSNFVQQWNDTKQWALEIGLRIRDKAVDIWNGFKTAWGDAKAKVAEISVAVRTRAGEIWNQITSWFRGRSIGLQVYYTWPSSKWQQSLLSALGLAGWPHLSFAAKGGIVDSATLFGSTVVGEAGKEAIIPLERNTGWMDGVAARIEQGLGAEMVAAFNSGSNEQNSLLREQNRLLRALLDKDPVIRPSAAMGQLIKRSSDLYARTIG